MNMLAQFNQNQKTIEIDGAVIRQDQHGRFHLNDLHIASGGLDKNKPSNFLRQDQIQALVAEIERCSDMSNGVNAIESIRGGLNQGTYAVKQIVYAYAMWISPSFNLKVINTFDAVVTGNLQPQITTPQDYLSALKALVVSEEQKQIAQQQLAIAAPKVQYFDRVADVGNLMTASTVGKKLGMSAQVLNEHLKPLKVYDLRQAGKIFAQWFIDKGFGEVKKTSNGYNTSKFTNKGEQWIVEKLTSGGVV